MKIGFAIDDSIDSNDGVQQYVRTLSSWLISKGHEVHYLAGQSLETANVHSLSKNIRVKFNGNSLSIPVAVSTAKIHALLKREKYDVLHVQMPYSPLLAGKIIKNAPRGTAIVGTFHILPYGRFQSLGNKALGMYQRKSLAAMDTVVFVSPAAKAFARKTYNLNGEVVPNMITLACWKNRVKNKPGRIVFLGRLVPRKGCKELLLTLSALPVEIKNNLEIIIAGDGSQRKILESLAAKTGLKVEFMGFIEESDKAQLLASAEVAVFPSLAGESFGIVLLEAMAAGAGLVVGGDNPGYRSVLGAFPDCLINFKNEKQSARQLEILLNSSEARNALHMAQQHHVKTYDTDIVGRKILNIYKAAIAKQAVERDNEQYAQTKKT